MQKAEMFFAGALLAALAIAGAYFAFYSSPPAASTANDYFRQENFGEQNDDQGDSLKQIIVLETSKGSIEVELDAVKAPVTVKNFLEYANSGFYDGTVFHRVIDGFMAQAGGFTPDGKEKDASAAIGLESQNGLKNLRGSIAMARTNDPDSATSQFFINLADNEFLNAAPGNDGYAVFGKVVNGMEVVDAIAKVRTATRGPHDDWPVEDVVITKAFVKK